MMEPEPAGVYIMYVFLDTSEFLIRFDNIHSLLCLMDIREEKIAVIKSAGFH